MQGSISVKVMVRLRLGGLHQTSLKASNQVRYRRLRQPAWCCPMPYVVVLSSVGSFIKQCLQSKLIVLSSLSVFLRNALALPDHASTNSTHNSSETSLPTWYLTSAFASQEAYEAFDKLLQPLLQSTSSLSSSRRWDPEIDPEMGDEDFMQTFGFATAALGNQWGLHDLSEVVNQSSTFTDGDASRSTDSTFVVVRSHIPIQ